MTPPYTSSPTLSAPLIAAPTPAPAQPAVPPEALSDGVVIDEGAATGDDDNVATDPTASESPPTWAEQVEFTSPTTSFERDLPSDAELLAIVNAPRCCGLTLTSGSCKVCGEPVNRRSARQVRPPKKFEDFKFIF